MEELELYLDTNIIIEFLKDKDSPAGKLVTRSRDAVQFFITAITVYELLYGPRYTGYQKELSDIEDLLLWVHVLPFDKEAARIAAEIDVMLHNKGKPIELWDVFIAAICIRNSLPIVTRNTTHFNMIEKETKYRLEVLTPEQALQNI